MYGKTKGVASRSTFLSLSYYRNLDSGCKHYIYANVLMTNYRYKYESKYFSSTYNGAYSTSDHTGSKSGYTKFSLLYGYNFYQNRKLKIKFLTGPSINLQVNTGVWGKTNSESIEDPLGYVINKTLLVDTIIKKNTFSLGAVSGLSMDYNIFKNRAILHFNLSYNYGFNSINQINTQTISNGQLYDRATIVGNGTGLFFSLGLVINKKKHNPDKP